MQMRTGTSVHVVNDTARRGSQVFARDLTTAMAARGARVELLALTSNPRAASLDLPVLGPAERHPRTLLALRRRMSATDAPLLVAHGSSTLAASAAVSAGLRAPVVYRQISDSLFWAPTWQRRIRVRAYYSQMDHVVALWDGAADVLVQHFGVAASKITVIPNAVPAPSVPVRSEVEKAAARRRLGLTETRPTVVYVGALAPEKGVADAIAVAAGVPEAQLLFVGDGPERPALEQAASLLPPGSIAFSGALPDPEDAYAAADVLLLPSRGGDSMPAVLLEAGLRGLPCVTTDVAAISRIVLDGKTGFVLPPSDVRGMAAAVSRLLSEPDTAAELGAAARAHCATHFAIDVVAEQWDELLTSIGQQGVRRAPGRPG